jgi:hypothetical protein
LDRTERIADDPRQVLAKTQGALCENGFITMQLKAPMRLDARQLLPPPLNNYTRRFQIGT